MDEKILQVLNMANWHYIKGLKQHKIVKFIDPQGGTWDVSIPQCPCGCKVEGESNAFRYWLHCPDHLERGILVLHYAASEWVWIPAKLEEGRK